MVHGVVGLVFIAIMLAHIYIGTIGMQGAFQAMGRGEVDANWARQHHSLWLEKQAKKGRVRGAAPAE
jgi:formate dehydrogenase subunit gamma